MRSALTDSLASSVVPPGLRIYYLMRTPLSDIEIQRELSALDGWSRKGNSLIRTFEFPSFASGIAFVDRVARIADNMDHHPDIDIRYTKISFHLSTHSAGGITPLDLKLAAAIDAAAAGAT